jgi:two-component system CheB/CheR fusion protein
MVEGRPVAGDEARPAFIVGMGGSAGGLEAFVEFFSHLPPDTGLAFVLVPHLEPTHKGMLPELLGRHTTMKVVEAEDGMTVQRNQVYVIPPNADLALLHGKLQVLQPTEPRGRRLPIDVFFRHLAADQKDRAIGIILSGMGSDGSMGLRSIKECLGVGMVQDPLSAKFDGMPRSAINTGMVDFIASAQGLPDQLLEYCTHAPAIRRQFQSAEAEPSAALEKVFVLLRDHTGNDFSCYKTNTIQRRIDRRMSVHQFDHLPRYLRFLQENPQEVGLLYKELLIGVTNFFRDPGLFDFLKESVFPRLFDGRPAGSPVRVWNPGCSTGEETYSLAILLKECSEKIAAQGNPEIQIFATDIDKDAIDKARRGEYSAGIATNVSPERLERFFIHDGEGYHIRKEIRDLIVFAPQNLLVDPPFTKMDILCCRNLLIYVNADTQRKLLPLMHYVLNPGGFLILGTAESIAGFDRLYSPVDRKWKVFQRREVVDRPRLQMPTSLRPQDRAEIAGRKSLGEPEMDVSYVVQRALLDSYGPPAVVVNVEGDILYVNGRTGKYLEPSSGKTNNNIFAMAREGLRDEVHTALHNSAAKNVPVTSAGVRVKSNGGFTIVNLTVKPLVELTAPRMFLIVFEEISASLTATDRENRPISPGADVESTELEDELRRTRDRLHATVEEKFAVQEELHSANEELQSNNEELQSINEELNSSKEELQSLNEEMQTVNAELETRIEELSQSNSDMKNLLNGTEIATIFLDSDLGIKRFTSPSAKIVNLATSDVGRPLGHFTTNLKYDRLTVDARQVLDTLVPKEVQVQTTDGRWYEMRVLPYRTANNVIDGVVMTFSDITAMKRLEELLRRQQAEAKASRDFAENIIATIREPFVVLDGDLRIVSASDAFYVTFQVTPAMIEGRLLYEIGQKQWNIPGLRQLLEDILPKSNRFDGFRVEHEFPTIGRKVLLLNGRQMEGGPDPARLILLAMEDVTASSEPSRQPRVEP